MRIFKSHPLLRLVNSYIIDSPQPSNLSYLWNFGSLLAFCLIIQIVTGVTLAMHYNPSVLEAFNSVEHIMRDVNNGWLVRYLHSNTASAFFFLVYLHIGRNLYYASYKAPRTLTFALGVVILVVMMATAFLGYVLPYGQMSLWGATVITNLMSAIPWIGQDIVEFIWGGFSVNNATLNRFFALHFVLPFVIAALALMHLIALHDTAGSSNPLGVSGNYDRLAFAPYFIFKDLVTIFLFIVVLSVFVFFMPNVLGDSENYVVANPMQTPPAIVPEWYLLPFYAILRSIPNKLLGVIAMFAAILILLTLPFTDLSRTRGAQFKPFSKVIYYVFVANFLMLMVLGAKHVESPFIELGQISTVVYFLYFLFLVPQVTLLENTLIEMPTNEKAYETYNTSSPIAASITGIFNLSIPQPYTFLKKPLQCMAWEEVCPNSQYASATERTNPTLPQYIPVSIHKPVGNWQYGRHDNLPGIWDSKGNFIACTGEKVDKFGNRWDKWGFQTYKVPVEPKKNWYLFERDSEGNIFDRILQTQVYDAQTKCRADPHGNFYYPNGRKAGSIFGDCWDNQGNKVQDRYGFRYALDGTRYCDRGVVNDDGELVEIDNNIFCSKTGQLKKISETWQPTYRKVYFRDPRLLDDEEDPGIWWPRYHPDLNYYKRPRLTHYDAKGNEIREDGYKYNQFKQRIDLYGRGVDEWGNICDPQTGAIRISYLDGEIFDKGGIMYPMSSVRFQWLRTYADLLDSPRAWGLYFQDSASPQMEGLTELHDNIMFYLVIILFAVGWILVSVIRNYSYQSSPISHKYANHGTLIELIWTITPALILILIAFPSFKLLYLMDEVSDPAMAVLAEGHQWYWSYQYPDFLNSDEEFVEFDSYLVPESDLEEGALRMLEVDNRVILPELTHVRFIVTAADVIHSYACPALGIKCDAYPGRLSQVSVLINRVGVFYGQCSEICGILHSSMPIVIQSLPIEKFLSWLEEQ